MGVLDSALSGIVSGGGNIGADISGQLPDSRAYREAMNTILDNVSRALETSADQLRSVASTLERDWSAPPAIAPFEGRVASTYVQDTTESFSRIRNIVVEPTRAAIASLDASIGAVRSRKG